MSLSLNVTRLHRVPSRSNQEVGARHQIVVVRAGGGYWVHARLRAVRTEASTSVTDGDFNQRHTSPRHNSPTVPTLTTPVRVAFPASLCVTAFAIAYTENSIAQQYGTNSSAVRNLYVLKFANFKNFWPINQCNCQIKPIEYCFMSQV